MKLTTRMFAFPIMLAALTASFVVSAAQMKTYEFTKSFTECVRNKTSENTNNTIAGMSESSLMNGSSVMNGSSINGSYWSYMNCLNNARSDTVNSETESGTSCPSFSITVGGRQLTVPPALPGKTIGIKGKSYICTSGGWSYVGGIGSGLPTETNSQCSAKTVTSGQCRFDLPASDSGRYSSAIYQSDSSNGSSSFYNGKATALCTNGNYEVVEVSCVRQVCSSEKEVTWASTSGVGAQSGQNALCVGEIDSYGYARLLSKTPRYFDSLEEARAKTDISVGSAQFTCVNNIWKEKVSSCRKKQAQEFVCSSRKDANGNYEYACQ